MNKFDVWYSLVHMNSKVKLEILKEYKATENIWENTMGNDKFLNAYSSKLMKVFKKAWDEEEINKLINIIENNNINIINYFDDKYPIKLKQFDDAPCVLYYKGDIDNLNNKSISIVGSRKHSFYGENVTELICKEVVKYNINVISGLARGIDTIAHKSTLNNNGYTCAVLGSGIDVIYPKENFRIYEDVSRTGCVLSEFPPQTKPFAYNFPIRNRIISGLSDIVVIIEADIKSGSLITANLALNQGKDVMAVPGSIFNPTSRGTNKLIKDGAYPLTEIEDLFELLDIYLYGDKNNKNFKKNTTNGKKYDIIDNVLSDKPIHIDEIIQKTDIDIQYLYELLFEMQINNHVKCLAGNYYVKINSGFI